MIENSGILLFYLRLLRIQLIQTIRREENTPLNVSDRRYQSELKKSLQTEKDRHPQYYKTMTMLTDDCLCAVNNKQEEREEKWLFHASQDEDIDKEKLYHQIRVFTDSRNYFNHYGEESNGMIGFYKDLYLFYLMNAEMRWAK